MSQSTTDSLSTPVQCSQNDTYDERLRLNYPDRQDDMVPESTDESFAASSMASATSITSITSITPVTPVPNASQQVRTQTTRTFTEEEIQKVKDDIAEMNQRFVQHGYEAFVHNKMHLIFKVYPFDLH